MDAVLFAIARAYAALGLNSHINEGDVWALFALIFLSLAIVAMIVGALRAKAAPRIEKAPEEIKKAGPPKVEAAPKLAPSPEPSTEKDLRPEPAPVVKPGLTWSERLSKGLSRSRTEVWGKLGSIFGGAKINDETIEEVEELLYGADIGPAMVGELVSELTKLSGKDLGPEEFKDFLYNFLRAKLEPVQEHISPEIYQYNPETHKGTKVIMVVGVNGAGKTTTIGKLATKLTRQGAKVVVGACDTFRAAAVDQLQVWCERAGAQMIRAKEGASPSGVGYEALQTALNSGANYCILDTAGRLHTASNLMDELKKSKEVLRKLDPEAPEHTLLVIDAITGQNALRQAEEFHKTLELNGLIFTKCDGSSKAGSAIGIVQKLGVPLAYIGVGESVEDLNVFNLDDYLNALLDRQSSKQPEATLH